MANDVFKIISDNEIKNGTLVVTTNGKAAHKTNDGAVKNTDIVDIQDKYDIRFDDVRYYSGDTAE